MQGLIHCKCKTAKENSVCRSFTRLLNMQTQKCALFLTYCHRFSDSVTVHDTDAI